MREGGKEGGAQFKSKQLSYYNSVFFQGKVTYMVTYKEKTVIVFTSLVLKGHM